MLLLGFLLGATLVYFYILLLSTGSHLQTEIRLNFCVFLWKVPPHYLYPDLTCVNLIFLILVFVGFVGFFALRTTASRLVLHISSRSSAAKSGILNRLFTLHRQVGKSIAGYTFYPELTRVPQQLRRMKT